MKKINELTIDELKIVFDNNEKIQREVYDNAMDMVNIYINDYMNSFERGTIEYNIGYPGDYIKVKDRFNFIQGLRNVYKSFCILPDESLKIINYCDELMDRYDNISYYDVMNSELLENRINQLIEELSNIFFIRVLDEYNYYMNGDNLQEYFIETYIETMNDEKYYVDENYILYQHLEYEKSYK
jgi:hypothetical protein